MRPTSPLNKRPHGLALAFSILCVSLWLLLDTPTARAATPSLQYVKGPGQKKLVIFVHGVLGNSEATWTNPGNGASWPRQFASDPELKAYDIAVYGYLSPLLGNASNANQLASRFAQELKDRGVFKNYEDISFITHSMGGIVTKSMLDTLNTPSQIQLLKRVRCVLYISVPSNGSDLAALASWLSNNPQFESMSPRGAADFLQLVENEWAELLRERTQSSPFPKTYRAYETLATKGFKVVPELYASQSDGTVQPYDYDHESIVKPKDRNVDIYLWARSRILESSALAVEIQQRKASRQNPKPSIRQEPQIAAGAPPGSDSFQIGARASALRTPGSPGNSIQLSFTTSGEENQEERLGVRPRKLFVDPPGRIVESGNLPARLTFASHRITIKAFTDTGIVIDSRGSAGMRLQVSVIDADNQKTASSPPSSVPESRPPNTSASADTIPIGGDASQNKSALVGSITQGPGSIAQVGGSGNTATIVNGPSEWRLTDSQKKMFGTFAGSLPDDANKYIVVSDLPDKQSHDYTSDLFHVLDEHRKVNRWGHFLTIPQDAPYGVVVVVHDGNDPNYPTAQRIVAEMQEEGIPVAGVFTSDNVAAKDIQIRVGLMPSPKP